MHSITPPASAAGIEKQKFAYVMNRDASGRLTISSPLEAHKGTTITFDVVGVDVGLENPIFACIEVDYADADADATGEAAKEVEKVRPWRGCPPARTLTRRGPRSS